MKRAASALIFALGACVAPGASEPAIRIEPRVDRSVMLRAPSVGGVWNLRFPESLFADPAVSLLAYDDPSVVSRWERLEGGGVRGQAAVRTDIAYAANLRPAGEAVELSLRLTNTGDRKLENVVAHVCLSHDHGEVADRFADPGHERTYVMTMGGMTCLSKLQSRVRGHYLVKGSRPISLMAAGWRAEYWGPIAPEPVESPLIAGTSASGRSLVAIAWGTGAEVIQNGSANSCIHVNPAFGDLAPGESREVLGRIYFLPNDLEGLLRRFHVDRAAGRLR